MDNDCNVIGNDLVIISRDYGLCKRKYRLISIRIMDLFLMIK